MSIHPDIAITLAAQRVAEYHRLAARRHVPPIRMSRHRRLLEALARMCDRRLLRPLRATGRTPQLQPTALPVRALPAK
jgi:hypothetical protein